MWVGDELTCMRFNVSGNILLRRLNILAFLLCAPNCRQEEKKKKEKKRKKVQDLKVHYSLVRMIKEQSKI